MMKLTQLVARGTKWITGTTGIIHSKKLFLSRKEAVNYIPKFVDICTKPQSDGDFSYLCNDETLDIQMIELELDGVTLQD